MELTLRRRPRYEIKRPARPTAGVPRVPAPTMAGEEEVGVLVRQQTRDAQNARFSQAKLSVAKLAETNPVGAAQFWLDFLSKELATYPDLYPGGSADRTDMEAEIVSAQTSLAESRRTMSGAELEAQLATGGLTNAEKVQLLRQRLATLPEGSEEYYNTLAQIRELEAAIGEAGAGEAWNSFVDRTNAEFRRLEDAYQAGEITGAEYDRQLVALYKSYIDEAKRQGKDVSDTEYETYRELEKRSKMDPKTAYDIYEIDPSTGGYVRTRTTKHRLTEQGLGVIELQDVDPTTKKVTSYPVTVKSSGTKENPQYSLINPATGEETTTILNWKGEEQPLSELFGTSLPGAYIRTAPIYETDPTTGVKDVKGYAFASPTAPLGKETPVFGTDKEGKKVVTGYVSPLGQPVATPKGYIGGREAAEAKIRAFRGEWEPLPTPPAVSPVVAALATSPLARPIEAAQRTIERIAPVKKITAAIKRIVQPTFKSISKALAPTKPVSALKFTPTTAGYEKKLTTQIKAGKAERVFRPGVGFVTLWGGAGKKAGDRPASSIR